jgi:hypothetical protein
MTSCLSRFIVQASMTAVSSSVWRERSRPRTARAARRPAGTLPQNVVITRAVPRLTASRAKAAAERPEKLLPQTPSASTRPEERTGTGHRPDGETRGVAGRRGCHDRGGCGYGRWPSMDDLV